MSQYNSEFEIYLGNLKNLLNDDKTLLECLEKRIRFNNQKLLNLNISDEEANEITIQNIKSKAEIKSIQSSIDVRTKHYNEFIKLMEKDIEEMNSKYNLYLKKANDLKTKNPEIKSILDSVSLEKLNDSIENKVFFFKKLKSLIDEN